MVSDMRALHLPSIQIVEFVRAIKELNTASQDKIIERLTEKPKVEKKMDKNSTSATASSLDNVFEKVNIDEEELDKAGADTVEFNGYQDQLFDNGREDQAPPRKSSIW